MTPAYSHATHPTRSRVVANPKRAECDAKWTCRWCSFLKRSTKECSTRVPIHLTRCGDISHTKSLPNANDSATRTSSREQRRRTMRPYVKTPSLSAGGASCTNDHSPNASARLTAARVPRQIKGGEAPPSTDCAAVHTIQPATTLTRRVGDQESCARAAV